MSYLFLSIASDRDSRLHPRLCEGSLASGTEQNDIVLSISLVSNDPMSSTFHYVVKVSQYLTK